MVVHKMSNPKSFVTECEKVGVTYERLSEAQECIGKQATARMFHGKSKRGGGGFASAVSIENWMETFKYALEHPEEEDHDPYQSRDIRPTEEWKTFMSLIYQPIEEAIIGSWKTMSNKQMGEEAKKYGMVVGTSNNNSLKDIHERLMQMVERRQTNFWGKKLESEENQTLNYSLLNIFQLREMAKERGISTNMNKEELIMEIQAYQEQQEDSLVVSYNEMSTSRLKLVAKERGLLEYNNLKKEELIQSLQKLDEMEEQQRDRITLGGIEVISRKEDGYINATQLCKAGEKEYSGWFRNSKTEEFLNELGSVLQICRTDLLKINQGGNDQGTWVHPRVAIHIAQWVSPKFAVIVTGWIHTLLASGNVSIDTPVTSFSKRTEMDAEAEVLEQDVEMERYTTDSVIYVSYIGKGMIKVGFSDGRLLQRNKKHTSTESMYSQWRMVHMVRVSGKPVEKLLHDFLYPYQSEFNKQKEIYKPNKTIHTFLDMIDLFIEDNDLPMKIRKLEKRVQELELENALLRIK